MAVREREREIISAEFLRVYKVGIHVVAEIHHRHHVACLARSAKVAERAIYFSVNVAFIMGRSPCLSILCSMIGRFQTNVEWNDIGFNRPKPSFICSSSPLVKGPHWT